MKSWAIVGYSFRADNYCPACTVKVLPTGPGEAFDGWALAGPIRMTTEDNLDEIAAAFGINRMDEHSFDTKDFPKVVFADQVESAAETCGRCHNPLIA